MQSATQNAASVAEESFGVPKEIVVGSFSPRPTWRSTRRKRIVFLALLLLLALLAIILAVTVPVVYHRSSRDASPDRAIGSGTGTVQASPVSPSVGPTIPPTWSPSVYPTTPPQNLVEEDDYNDELLMDDESNPIWTRQPAIADGPSAKPVASVISFTFAPKQSPAPTISITESPSNQSLRPTGKPTDQPTGRPTNQPTRIPTNQPSARPITEPTTVPSTRPTLSPTKVPTVHPTPVPTLQPQTAQPQIPESPTQQPVEPTDRPTLRPSNQPTNNPSPRSSEQPTHWPTPNPTKSPITNAPIFPPSWQPTKNPTLQPSWQPTEFPIGNPTKKPSINLEETTFYITGGRFKGQFRSTLPDLLASLPNADPDTFMVQLGDWNNAGVTECEEWAYQNFASVYESSSVPVYVIMGDNEWNKCPNRNAAFELFEKYCLRFDMNWKPPSFTRWRQGSIPKNFGFSHNGILFIGLHLTPGDGQDEEIRDRELASFAWIQTMHEQHSDKTSLTVIFSHIHPRQTDFYQKLSDRIKNLYQRPFVVMHKNLRNGGEWAVKQNAYDNDLMTMVRVEGAVWPPMKVVLKENYASFDQSNWM